jgi:hypothetical protein
MLMMLLDLKIIQPRCQVVVVTAPTDVPSAPGTVQITIPYADNTVAWPELNKTTNPNE